MRSAAHTVKRVRDNGACAKETVSVQRITLCESRCFFVKRGAFVETIFCVKTVKFLRNGVCGQGMGGMRRKWKTRKAKPTKRDRKRKDPSKFSEKNILS